MDILDRAFLDPEFTGSLPGRKTVLVLEDDSDLSYGLSVLLQRKYKIRTADTAEQAMISFDTKTPDLLVVDYQLPDMDGFQFLEAVRNYGGDSPPAIMISAYTHLKDEARKNGFQGFLEKPFSTLSLSHAIELALG